MGPTLDSQFPYSSKMTFQLLRLENVHILLFFVLSQDDLQIFKAIYGNMNYTLGTLHKDLLQFDAWLLRTSR